MEWREVRPRINELSFTECRVALVIGGPFCHVPSASIFGSGCVCHGSSNYLLLRSCPELPDARERTPFMQPTNLQVGLIDDLSVGFLPAHRTKQTTTLPEAARQLLPVNPRLLFHSRSTVIR
jgi:hypothetical protein